jgi:predicted CXXCH cytochrome family protein
MFKNNFSKFLIGVSFALIFGFLASVLGAQASDTPSALNQFSTNCEACHKVVQETWDNGLHSQAGITCTTCHYPATGTHPQEVMPTDVSSRLCASCHVATAQEFTLSHHSEEDLTCVRCHSGHSATLRTGALQDLCENCHRDVVHFYGNSAHASKDILCTDCHMQIDNADIREGPGDLTHTFEANLATCNNCHLQDMHNPHEDACSEEEIAEAEASGKPYPCDTEDIVQAGLAIPEEEAIVAEPSKAGPLGFTVIGTLVGMAAGMILAPWLENWFKRIREEE